MLRRRSILAPLQRIFDPILTIADFGDGWWRRFSPFSNFPLIGWLTYEREIFRRTNEPWSQPPMLGFTPGAFLLEASGTEDLAAVFPLQVDAQIVDEPGTISVS